MASTNKNLIQSLRSAHDPHFKLEGRVEGLEKNIPIQIAELHKTLSKSFGMQRKTLARVLGLESRLSNLEVAIEVWTSREASRRQQEAEQKIEEVAEEVADAVEDVVDQAEDQVEDSIDEEIPEQLDNVLDDIRGEEEIGGSDDVAETTPTTSTATKPKPKRKRLRIRKRKISGADLKKGSSQETETGEQQKISSEDLKKGSSQESIEKIESRVSDNEKKIELVKNILKAQKSDLAEKLRSLEPESEPESESESESEQKQISSPLLETLQAIAATTESIRDTLIQKQDNDKDIMEDIRVDQEKADADKQEKGLENTKPKPLAKLGEKIAAPVVGLFGKIFNFIKTLFLGKFLMNFLDWFGNPENQGKIQSLIKFVGDYWPALTAAVLLFGTGFGGLVSGLLTSVAAFIPKMIAAVATMNPLLAIGLGTAAVVGGTALYMNNKKKNKEDENQQEDQQEEPQKFNKGGQVSGSGNKDTVPAMLTPGEFVMSKGAVEQYGVNTLEGMNAAAGGTNMPTIQQNDGKKGNFNAPGYSGGGQGGKIDKSHYGTTGYRIGQVMPDQYVYDFSKYTSSYKTKGGEVIEDKETLTELGGAIGVPDLLEHQKQLVGDIRKVEGYENVNIIDVMERMNGRGRLVSMPDETLYPILNASDAYKATGDKMVAAHKMDLESRGITDPSKGYSMMYNGGGLVQGLNGGGLVQGFQGGGRVRGKSKMYNIKSREPKNTVIAYEQEANKEQQKSAPASGGNEIPSFDVAPIRDPLKMTTLQIVLF